VISRAQEVLADLENDHGKAPGSKTTRKEKSNQITQITFFGPKPAVLEELQNMDLDGLTPLEALNKLYELQKKARET
jgi:DNA mismatch repair protein MutS